MSLQPSESYLKDQTHKSSFKRKGKENNKQSNKINRGTCRCCKISNEARAGIVLKKCLI